MEFVRQAIPDGDTGIMGQIFYRLLAEAAVFNAVEHAAQNPGGVGNGLFLAHLGAARIQIGDAQAQVPASHLEGAAGAGGGLFKQQDDVLAGQVPVRRPGALHALKVFAQLQQVADFGRGIVQKLQIVSSTEIDRHSVVPSFFRI